MRFGRRIELELGLRRIDQHAAGRAGLIAHERQPKRRRSAAVFHHARAEAGVERVDFDHQPVERGRVSQRHLVAIGAVQGLGRILFERHIDRRAGQPQIGCDVVRANLHGFDRPRSAGRIDEQQAVARVVDLRVNANARGIDFVDDLAHGVDGRIGQVD